MKHPSFGRMELFDLLIPYMLLQVKQEQVTGEGADNYEPDVLFAQIAPPVNIIFDGQLLYPYVTIWPDSIVWTECITLSLVEYTNFIRMFPV